MMMNTSLLHRRRLLAALGAGALPALFAPDARADDYRALVCVFLFGGNDGLNTVVPLDGRHADYASVRKTLALPKASLARLGSSDYGLHPALAPLASASKRLAAVFNTGPLVAPLTKADYLAAKGRGPTVPASLFSHSDQQLLWEAGSADLQSRTGWGGRAAQQMRLQNPVISVGGNGRFGLSDSAVPMVLPSPGEYFGAYVMADDAGPAAKRKAALQTLYAGSGETALATAFASQQREAFSVSERLRDLVWLRPGDIALTAAIDAAFAPLVHDGKFSNPLASQLYQVAKLVLGRAVVGGSRQIFFAQQGGYDTHNAQIADDVFTGQHAGLLKSLGDALAAFDAAMLAIGMGDAVTLFTQSDFGRTFAPNASNGTDHAWGNTQLVLGGAVKGGFYGRYPELALGGPDDVGIESWERHGRWLPSMSVDQYAATLLRWLGASEAQLDATLPNLRNFGSARSVGFMAA